MLFTSKNAIDAIDSIDKAWKKVPSYAIAKQTAQKIVAMGGIVEYQSSCSYGDEFAKEISPMLKNKKVLYLRAKKVVSNLVNILKSDGIEIKDEIVYFTKILTNIDKKLKPPKNATIIFSSPSTVDGFLSNFKWDDTYKAVAIGKTTSSYMPQYINHTIAPTPNMTDAIKTAKLLEYNFSKTV